VPDIGATISKRPQVQMASPPTMSEDDRAPLRVEIDHHVDPEMHPHGHETFHVQSSYLPRTTSARKLQGNVHAVEEVPDAEHHNADSLQDIPLGHMIPDGPDKVPRPLLNQLPLSLGVQSEAEVHPEDHNAVNLYRSTGHESHKKQAASRSKTRHTNVQPPQQSQQPWNHEQMITNISSQPPPTAKNDAQTKLSQQLNTVLHDVCSQHGPVRIEKTQTIGRHLVICKVQRYRRSPTAGRHSCSPNSSSNWRIYARLTLMTGP
jgi:hypothetical protein